MIKRWTDDQLKAIESRGENLLVAAAAGSGKTALLIERIFRIVEEGVSINELLVLTFTKGAAGEMKNRLNLAFSKALETAEGEKRQRLLTQMSLLGNASISTFHSFCLSLLRIYFHRVAIDPGFVIGNDIEMTLMRKEALEEVFEHFYEKSQDDSKAPFLRLVDQYAGNKNDQALKDLIEEFYFFLSAQPYPDDYCKQALAFFDFDKTHFEETLWGQKLSESLLFQLKAACDYAEKAMIFSDSSGFEKAYAMTEKEFKGIELLVENLKDKKDSLSQLLKDISQFEFKRFAGNKKADPDLNEKIKNYRNQAKQQIETIKKRYASHFSLALTELKESKPIMESLITVTAALGQVFADKKKAKNILDYNDLEQLTLRLLQDAEIAKEIQSRYRYVFIDEYQDTNEMQETILKKIVRQDNFFMVGDVKQSIYRFRLADPSIFMGKYHQFAQGEKGNRIDLTKNFRSSKAVIDSVNNLFSKIMSVELGEIKYDKEVQLNAGLQDQDHWQKTEIHLIAAKSSNNEAAPDYSRAELEASLIAKKIISLVGKPLYRSRQGREEIIQYKDFGVLLRSVAQNGQAYLKVFRDYQIPTYFEGQTRYYESLEITTIINLLNLLDNDHQDIPLLSLMVSPIGHFETEECSKIRINHPTGYFYEAVEAYRDQVEDPLSEKLKAFYQSLESWRQASKRLAVDDFLWKIYMESNYYHFVGALTGGEQRQNNLKILLKRAADYKKSTLRGLYQFIHFIENMKKYKQDVSPSQSISDQDNVVRLMTIHKSKGLEFPIVFIGGLSQQFNKRDNLKPVLFHKQLGICPDYVDEDRRFRRSSLAKEICKDQNNLELLSEEMRLLYVAMTRAEEKLHLVAGVKESFKQGWQEEAHPHHLISSSSFLDWIMTALLKDDDLRTTETIEFEHFVLHHYQDQVVEAVKVPAQIKKLKPLKGDATIAKKVNDRLSFNYNQTSPPLPGKMSVSEISQASKKTQLLTKPEKPKFLQNIKTSFTAAEKGTALHMLLETLNLQTLKAAYQQESATAFKAFLKTFLTVEKQRLIDADYLPAELAKTIDLTKLEAFYLSALGKRILKSSLVKREWAFTYALDPREINPKWQGTETSVLVQGIIDCVFLEDDAFVVIDYKTDYFKNDHHRLSRIKLYQPQIELYAKALNQLGHYPVKEKIISFITMRQNISLK